MFKKTNLLKAIHKDKIQVQGIGLQNNLSIQTATLTYDQPLGHPLPSDQRYIAKIRRLDHHSIIYFVKYSF